MSKSTHQFEIKGVDKSAGAFGSIKNRAAVTSAQIRSMVGGAIAAAGAYLSFRAIKGGIDELGRLSDVAQKAGVSVDDLTQATTAFGVLGIQNMGVDGFAKSMMFLAKNTGRTGMAGFYQTIEEIGKVPDVSKRAEMAMRVFGKSGMEFMPIINAADKSVAALKKVAEAMPKVPQSAADAGDDIADGTQIVTTQFKSWWLEAIGKVAGLISGSMPESFRQSMAIIMAYADYYVHSIGDILESTWKRLTSGFGFFTATSNAVGAAIGGTYEKLFGSGGVIPVAILNFEKFLVGFWQRTTRGFGLFSAAASAAGAAVGGTYEKLFGTGGTWGDVGKGIAEGWRGGWKDYDGEIDDIQEKFDKKRRELGNSHITWSDIFGGVKDAWKSGMQEYEDEQEEIDKRMDARAQRFAKRLEAARNLENNYKKAAKGLGDRTNDNDDGRGNYRQTRISNDLVMAGSNAAMRMQILGPTLQSESKKQTALLERIATNTEKTADNTEESATSESMGVID